LPPPPAPPDLPPFSIRTPFLPPSGPYFPPRCSRFLLRCRGPSFSARLENHAASFTILSLTSDFRPLLSSQTQAPAIASHRCRPGPKVMTLSLFNIDVVHPGFSFLPNRCGLVVFLVFVVLNSVVFPSLSIPNFHVMFLHFFERSTPFARLP